MDLRNAYFDDLVQQCVALGFNKDSGVDNIAKEEGGIFHWSDRTTKMLERTKMNGYSMVSKKVVLVAYLTFGRLLRPHPRVLGISVYASTRCFLAGPSSG